MIPEGAKSALAQIAASTIVGTGDTESDAAAPLVEGAAAIELPQPSRAETPETAEPASAKDRAKKPRKKRGKEAGPVLKPEAEQLLDSVLDALPEPKAPGQGRGRRRVTTAALSGTPVIVTPIADGGSDAAVAGSDA
ncbi:hypothetical protein [Microbacterium sp. NIBRBAC000506063]|uniref:hypothetical protein n=1 Tax=Microbacterium sp. NIBRBAC000506063 TaxID=2734618 RepID=UPI001CB6E098|nr:hypothetical protein [Microbacterium sp. NIBRBAC000506063]